MSLLQIQHLSRTEAVADKLAQLGPLPDAAEPVTPEAAKMAQVAPFSPKAKVGAGRGNKGGIREAARQMGVSRDELQRSLAIDAIDPEADAAAGAAGLHNNQSALLAIAAEPTPERQRAKVAELAARPAAPTKLDRAVAAWRKLSAEERAEFHRLTYGTD